ncbi:mitochondrial editing factor 20 [Wolffia australiana]
MSQLPRARCWELLGNSHLRLKQVHQIHAQMIVSAAIRQSSAVGRLIDRYADSSPILSRSAFFYHADELDLFAFNVMIRRSPPIESLSLYARLGGRGDDRSIIYALGSCARSKRFKEGSQIHAQIVKTRAKEKLHPGVLTTGVFFYGALGELVSARRLFDEMPQRVSPAWNALMGGLSLWGRDEEAAALFREQLTAKEGALPTERTLVLMLSACSRLGDLALGGCLHGYALKSHSIKEDVFLSTGLVDMYAKSGCLISARRAFDEAAEKNTLTWTAMTAGLAFHSRGDEATAMLDAMAKARVPVNAFTFTCLLTACSHGGLVEAGLGLFEKMSHGFGVEPGLPHYGCLVDLLGRAGLVEEARGVVRAMPIKPDAVLWRSLLAACRIHGRVELGEEIAAELKLGTEKAVDSEDYVAMANLFASGEMWEAVWMTREKMKVDGALGQPGFSSWSYLALVDSTNGLRRQGRSV